MAAEQPTLWHGAANFRGKQLVVRLLRRPRCRHPPSAVDARQVNRVAGPRGQLLQMHSHQPPLPDGRIVGPVLYDHAGAQKPDAGHDIGGNLRRSLHPVQARAKVAEGRRPHRHQHIGAQPRIALPPLPLQPNRQPQPERHRHDQQGLHKRAGPQERELNGQWSRGGLGCWQAPASRSAALPVKPLAKPTEASHTRIMDEEDTGLPPPDAWLKALDRAEADIAAGRTVPASVVHAMLEETIVRMEARARDLKATQRA